MRVILWSELYWPYLGGSTRFARQLVRALSAKKVEFVVVARRDEFELDGLEELDGSVIHRLPFCQALASQDPSQILQLQREVKTLFREFQPQLVHLNGLGPTNLFLMPALEKTPLLVTQHGEQYQPPGGQSLLAAILRRATLLTAPSRATANYLTRLGAADERVQVVYNGVADYCGWQPPPWPPRLLCLGRLDPIKGFDLALEALARCGRSELTLTIAGQGAQEQALKQRAARADLAGRVSFTGVVLPHQVASLLESHSAVLMPSRSEAMPLVALEAGAVGRALLATRVGGLPEVVRHRETGLLIPPEDIEALAEAVLELCADRGCLNELGRQAADFVRANFKASEQWARYHQIYRALVE